MPVDIDDSVNPDKSIVVDGKKFMWDGGLFESFEEASKQAEAYKSHKFEVQLVERGGKHLIYTRRAVRELAISAPE